MGAGGEIVLRAVQEGDLPVFYRQPLDPDANAMAAFSPRRGIDAFMAHWGKILGDEALTARTILVDREVAGYVAKFAEVS